MIPGFNQLLNAAASGATSAVVTQVFSSLGVDVDRLANPSSGASRD